MWARSSKVQVVHQYRVRQEFSLKKTRRQERDGGRSLPSSKCLSKAWLVAGCEGGGAMSISRVVYPRSAYIEAKLSILHTRSSSIRQAN
jgi:hypothetical protein